MRYWPSVRVANQSKNIRFIVPYCKASRKRNCDLECHSWLWQEPFPCFDFDGMMTETRDIVKDFSYGWWSLVQVGADLCISRQVAEREVVGSYPGQTKTQDDLIMCAVLGEFQ